ncbi:MAG: hypothetical protein WDZ86_01220, partial [Gammaproteobacteria bacterium]
HYRQSISRRLKCDHAKPLDISMHFRYRKYKNVRFLIGGNYKSIIKRTGIDVIVFESKGGHGSANFSQDPGFVQKRLPRLRACYDKSCVRSIVNHQWQCLSDKFNQALAWYQSANEKDNRPITQPVLDPEQWFMVYFADQIHAGIDYIDPVRINTMLNRQPAGIGAVCNHQIRRADGRDKAFFVNRAVRNYIEPVHQYCIAAIGSLRGEPGKWRDDTTHRDNNIGLESTCCAE